MIKKWQLPDAFIRCYQRAGPFVLLFVTIPVCLPFRVDMRIGGLMRKCSVVTGGRFPSMRRISWLFCFLFLYCNES